METQSWMDDYMCRRCGRCFGDMLNMFVLNALEEGGYMDTPQDSAVLKTGRTPAFIGYKAFVTPNRHITENELRERGWSGEEVWFRSCCNGKVRWFNTGIVVSIADDGLHADIDRSNWDPQLESGKITTKGVSQSLCKPPNRCKIRLLSLEVLLWQEKTKAHKKQQ